MTAWKPFTKTLENTEREPYEFFLIRPRGYHPATGKEFTPIVVQYIDGMIYSCDNELDPITYSHKDDEMEPCNDPFQCNLEWCDIPK